MQSKLLLYKRENENQLSILLEKYHINSPKNKMQIDYKINIHKFGNDFINLIELATI